MTGPAPPCVAIVDSDREHLRLIERLVTTAGYRPCIYEAPIDLPELRDIMASDLIVTTLFMPQFDGFELIRAVREAQPRLPIIATAPDGPVGDFYLRAARSLGADSILAISALATSLPGIMARLLKTGRNLLAWSDEIE
jgi:CheY-like chemotaxis protein